MLLSGKGCPFAVWPNFRFQFLARAKAVLPGRDPARSADGHVFFVIQELTSSNNVYYVKCEPVESWNSPPALTQAKEVTMAQADYMPNAIRALITGASAKPSTNPVRVAYAEFLADLAENPPRPIPVRADAADLQDRADHVEGVLTALSAYLNAVLEDTAENVPGGLDLRQIDALRSDLQSELRGTLQQASDGAARRVA